MVKNILLRTAGLLTILLLVPGNYFWYKAVQGLAAAYEDGGFVRLAIIGLCAAKAIIGMILITRLVDSDQFAFIHAGLGIVITLLVLTFAPLEGISKGLGLGFMPIELNIAFAALGLSLWLLPEMNKEPETA